MGEDCGSEGPASSWMCEFSRCTKDVFPEPAMPIVIITVGFFLDGIDTSDGSGGAVADDEEAIALINKR